MIQVCLFPVFLFKEWMCDFKLPPIKIKSNNNFWSWGKTVPLDLSHEIGFAGLWCAGNSNIPQSCKANPTISGNVKKELFFSPKRVCRFAPKGLDARKAFWFRGPALQILHSLCRMPVSLRKEAHASLWPMACWALHMTACQQARRSLDLKLLGCQDALFLSKPG